MIRLFRNDRPKNADSIVVSHCGESYAVAIKRVKTARRYILRVRSASRDVVLTMPARSSLRSAQDFAQRHAAWIGARLRRLPYAVPFENGAVIPVRGVEHHIVLRPDERGAVWIEANPGATPLLCVAGQENFLARRVGDFLRREAKRDLDAAVRRHAEKLGKQVCSITIRDTASRWGSCSAKGALNFSWRLIFAPPYVLDYLAAHECAHLAHMNHSAAFWKLTRRLSGDVDHAETWLNAHGAELHRFGADQRRTNVK